MKATLECELFFLFHPQDCLVFKNEGRTDISLRKGDLQWMTAGKGIMHSEMPLFDPDPLKREDSVGLQLWVDLPRAQKFIEPSYQERKAEE